ncbi:hypothetical protein GF312_07545 [Candidatus Poribacteria bacterium]|nr:hypothetical protein [Candidatus Poribacteria bacterium]
MYKRYVIYFSIICFTFLFLCPKSFSAETITVENIEVASGRAYVVPEAGIDVGTKYYIDRDYVVNLLPEELIGATFIMTGNDDKNSVGEDFLTFTVDIPTKVWLARDSRGDEGKAGQIPEWLSEDMGWERHEDLKIEVTDGNMGFFILYSKDFEKGDIVLGGNADPTIKRSGEPISCYPYTQ